MELLDMMDECEAVSLHEFGSMKAQLTSGDVAKPKTKAVAAASAAVDSLFGEESGDEDFTPKKKKDSKEEDDTNSSSGSDSESDEEVKPPPPKPKAHKKKVVEPSGDEGGEEGEEKKEKKQQTETKKRRKKSESEGDSSKNKKTQPKWLMPPICNSVYPPDKNKPVKEQRIYKYFLQVSFNINGDVKTFKLMRCVRGFGCIWLIKDMIQEPVKKSAMFRVVQVVPISELKGVPDGVDEKIDGKIRLVQTNRWALLEKKQIYKLDDLPVTTDAATYTTLDKEQIQIDGIAEGEYWFDTSLCAVAVEPGTQKVIDAKLISGPVTKLFDKSMFAENEEGRSDDEEENDKPPKKKKGRSNKIIPFEFMYATKPNGQSVEEFMKENYIDGNIPMNCRFRVDPGYEESDAVKKRRQTLLENASKGEEGGEKKKGEKKKDKPKKKKEEEEEEENEEEEHHHHHHHHGHHEKDEEKTEEKEEAVPQKKKSSTPKKKEPEKKVEDEIEEVVPPKKDSGKAKKEEVQPPKKKEPEKKEKEEQPAPAVVAAASTATVPAKSALPRIILNDAGGNSPKDMTVAGMLSKVKGIVDQTNGTETSLATAMLKSLKERSEEHTSELQSPWLV
jgi:hypothetical protein